MVQPPDLYSERAAVVVALARAAMALDHEVYLAHDPLEPDWPVLFIELPTGQVSWHLHPDDVSVFASDLPWIEEASDTVWDGHTTDEKYRRLNRWRP